MRMLKILLPAFLISALVAYFFFREEKPKAQEAAETVNTKDPINGPVIPVTNIDFGDFNPDDIRYFESGFSGVRPV